MKNKYATLLAIVLVVVVVDQWTKLMAVDYLRRPERSDFYKPCASKKRSCKQRCLQRAAAHGNLSLVACEKRCLQREEICQSKHGHLYDWALTEWKTRQREMKQSWMCQRVEYAGSSRPECVVLAKYFHFTYRVNRGAAWGIFSDLPPHVRRPFFMTITMIAILFILFLFVFRLESEHRLMVIALSLILGGAMGNFLDRIRLDYVIDFIEWFWKSRQYTWPTFNIADAAISIGVGLIAIELFFFAPPEDDPEESNSEKKESKLEERESASEEKESELEEEESELEEEESGLESQGLESLTEVGVQESMDVESVGSAGLELLGSQTSEVGVIESRVVGAAEDAEEKELKLSGREKMLPSVEFVFEEKATLSVGDSGFGLKAAVEAEALESEEESQDGVLSVRDREEVPSLVEEISAFVEASESKEVLDGVSEDSEDFGNSVEKVEKVESPGRSSSSGSLEISLEVEPLRDDELQGVMDSFEFSTLAEGEAEHEGARKSLHKQGDTVSVEGREESSSSESPGRSQDEWSDGEKGPSGNNT